MIKSLLFLVFVFLAVYIATKTTGQVINQGLLIASQDKNVSEILSVIGKQISPLDYNIVYIDGKPSRVYIEFFNKTVNCLDYVKINNEEIRYDYEIKDKNKVLIYINNSIEKPFSIDIGLCGRYIKHLIV